MTRAASARSAKSCCLSPVSARGGGCEGEAGSGRMIGRSLRHARYRAVGYKRPAHASSGRAGELGGATIHGVGRHFANAIRLRVKGEGRPESLSSRPGPTLCCYDVDLILKDDMPESCALAEGPGYGSGRLEKRRQGVAAGRSPRCANPASRAERSTANSTLVRPHGARLREQREPAASRHAVTRSREVPRPCIHPLLARLVVGVA